MKTLLDSQKALIELSGLRGLNVLTNFKIAKVLKQVDEEIVSFREAVNKRIKELGEEKDGKFSVKKENLEEWNTEYSEFLEKEVEIELPELSIKDFSALKDTSPSLFIGLDWLIKE